LSLVAAWAAASTMTLAITSGTATVTSVASGTTVTLTATVRAARMRARRCIDNQRYATLAIISIRFAGVDIQTAGTVAIVLYWNSALV
jgi:hypothetical protein